LADTLSRPIAGIIMLSSTVLPQPITAVPTVGMNQVYITHCFYDEGVFRKAGFNIRACSTRDSLLLRFAGEYPTFELPVDEQPADYPLTVIPRRLAMVAVPGGKFALIHSVHLPESDHGRANNFFSHVLFPAALKPCQALATWASPDWTTHCPLDTGKNLLPLP